MKFKTQISATYILVVLISFLFITQVDNFTKWNFVNKISWLIYGIIISCFFVFNLFFTWSFELFETYLKVNYPLFIRKSKVHSIHNIVYIRAINQMGKGLAVVKIKLEDKEFMHYHFLISKKSINGLITTLKEMNVDASIINSVTELNKR